MGRIIYDVALKLDHKFNTYTGIDFSDELTSDFKDNPKRDEMNLEGDRINHCLEDILKYNLP